MTEVTTPAVRPYTAIEKLTNNQLQCDMDGCMIQVSRQALDEVLTFLAAKPDEDGVREALKFYADAENYRSGDTHVNGMTRPVMQDRGNKARAALSTGKPKP